MKKPDSNQLYLATASILGQPPGGCKLCRMASGINRSNTCTSHRCHDCIDGDSVSGDDKNATRVLFMFGTLPPVVMNFMFAEHYGQEPQRVASIVLIANAFAQISIPLALVYALPQFE